MEEEVSDGQEGEAVAFGFRREPEIGPTEGHGMTDGRKE